MTKPLRYLLVLTDGLFLIYWALALLVLVDVVHIPPEYLYADSNEPKVVAWNWSFFPLDIAFSVFGLMAVRAARRGNPLWRPLTIISLVLTMTAGGMAVTYWAILGEFDPSWFLPNLALLVWPMFFLPGLCTDSAAAAKA